MSTKSKIEWTNDTWNPVSGCTHVSAGCDNCYAVKQTYRLEMMGQAQKYGGLTVLNAKGDRHFNGVVRCHEDALQIPLKRKKPTMYFVNSMSDLFHKGVPFEFIDKLFAVMALCPQHTFQVLTKRPERMAEYLALVHEERDMQRWINAGCDLIPESSAMYGQIPELFEAIVDWPLGNVWLGTSCENQAAADERIPHLLKCPAEVRFISAEPLLGPIDLMNADRDGLRGGLRGALHWVIVGGESGPRARACYQEWVETIVLQCRAFGVACFVKQLGKVSMVDPGDGDPATPIRMDMRDGKGGDPSHWPEELRVREFPKAQVPA